jgi:CTP:molybdopterin cytidylyltransferase MocA
VTSRAEAPDPPAGLLLAAGGGTRLGHPKALVPFRGEPLVCRGVRLLRRGGCGTVVVVVGAAADEVTALLADAPVQIVDNPDWRVGMGGSLRAGLAAVDAAPAAVVALVDQPLVSPEAVRRLTAAWRAGALVAAASYGGQARNPVLFDARVFAAAAAGASGDQGARALLRERPDWVERVACDAVASPRDIDTMDDLRALSVGPDPNPASLDDRPASKEPPWS